METRKSRNILTVLTEPKDGLPFDFNQFRVFTWNVSAIATKRPIANAWKACCP